MPNSLLGLLKNMFNKLKQIKDLRSQAKTMQSALSQESITVEKGGIKVVINGNMEVSSVSINQELSKDSIEGLLVEAVNEAIKKTQRLMAQKMQEMGGLPGLN
jgi:DNA-binding YbaB/EbfC family protein